MNEMHPSVDHIVDYLHGELSPAEDAAMHAHLAGCRSCDERRAEEVLLTEALRAGAHAGERELPAAVVAKIRQEIERPNASSVWDVLRAAFRPVLIIPAAAALAFALYLGFGGRHGTTASTPPTSIDAAEYVENHAAMAATVPFAEDAPPATLTSDNETP
jgi:anti-sigma factor RsiW